METENSLWKLTEAEQQSVEKLWLSFQRIRKLDFAGNAKMFSQLDALTAADVITIARFGFSWIFDQVVTSQPILRCLKKISQLFNLLFVKKVPQSHTKRAEIKTEIQELTCDIVLSLPVSERTIYFHLIQHLVDDIFLWGPVTYFHMFRVERYLRTVTRRLSARNEHVEKNVLNNFILSSLHTNREGKRKSNLFLKEIESHIENRNKHKQASHLICQKPTARYQVSAERFSDNYITQCDVVAKMDEDSKINLIRFITCNSHAPFTRFNVIDLSSRVKRYRGRLANLCVRKSFIFYA